MRRVMWATLLVALLYACGYLPVRTIRCQGTRYERFQQALYYYMEHLNVPPTRIVFSHDAAGVCEQCCAWVVRDVYHPGMTQAGLNEKIPSCQAYKPEWLALHEACHLRMAHTSAPFDTRLTNQQKEAEATACMRSYRETE